MLSRVELLELVRVRGRIESFGHFTQVDLDKIVFNLLIVTLGLVCVNHLGRRVEILFIRLLLLLKLLSNFPNHVQLFFFFNRFFLKALGRILVASLDQQNEDTSEAAENKSYRDDQAN